MMLAGMSVCFHHHVNSYYYSLSNFSLGGIIMLQVLKLGFL